MVDSKEVIPLCWSTGTRKVEKCELYDNSEFSIHIPFDIHTKIISISKAMGSNEWLGYLVGTVGEDDEESFYVSDLIVPEQVVTSVSVEVIAPLGREEIIGTIHLHPFANGLFLSGTDETYIGGNHKVTVVINSNESYLGAVKVNLPCHASTLIEAKVIIGSPPDVSDYVDEALGNIQVCVPQVELYGKQGANDAGGY